MLRIHSEIVICLALALAAMRFKSSALNRTGTMRPFASPLGSFGRPGFLVFFCGSKVPEFLNDCRSHGVLC